MNTLHRILSSLKCRVVNSIDILLLRIRILKAQKIQHKRVKQLRECKVLKCVFLATFEEVWKYDVLYRLMEKHERFSPVILVCPVVNHGYDNMMRRMEQCYMAFQKKGYNVLKSYDIKTGEYLDLKKDLQPDILFYTSPYKFIVDRRYYITSRMDILSVYVPYFINSNKDYKMACNEELHNLVWRRYTETEFHKSLSERYAYNKGINTVNTGYPGIEGLLNNTPKNTSPNTKKIIIWAPHHSIDPVGIIHYSCFMKYYTFMLSMAEKYKDQVTFVFKPHPLLKHKLNEKWGEEKTNQYYNSWRNNPYTEINEGDYIDLFNRSDAMIHDSASFIVEYLYTNKPVMRTLNGNDLSTMYNELGLQCINNHYCGNNEQDIEIFVVDTINGVDPMKEQRTRFINDVLMPQGSPSQNIINDLLDSIDNQIVFRK